jgi:N-acetylmuramoyl-L-alanine amidase
MITKVNNKRPGYLSRIMALPFLFILFCAFAVGLHKKVPDSVVLPLKTITVVIDAGHGGIDAGAVNKSGVTEKDLMLALAKKVKQYGPEYKVNVIMTREEDKLPGNANNIQDGLHYRTELATRNKADLFVSLHTNASTADSSQGFQVYVSPRNPYYRKSAKLGSALVEALKNNYNTDDQLKERVQGIWVLSGSDMPAILILCGNLDSERDLTYIRNGQNQESIARNILKGIVRYEQDGGLVP